MACFPIYQGSKVVGFMTTGDQIYTIIVGGKPYYFEFHRYCGPMECNRNGDGRLSPWPRRVWDAVQAWSDQGRKTDQNGRCIWESR